MFEVLCTGTKHTAVSDTGDVTVACRGAGVLKTRLWLCDSCWPSETAPGQAAVCAERHYTADKGIQFDNELSWTQYTPGWFRPIL